MIGWASSRLRGMRPLRLFMPSPWACAAAAGAGGRGLTAGGGGRAAVMPHRVSSAPARCLPGRARMATMRDGTGSGGGQRVVAELGQDVAGLAEDLAGLGQRSALGVPGGPPLGLVAGGRGRGGGGG